MPHSARTFGFESRVLDRVTSMLAYWDRDLRCRYANRAYEAWFGVAPASLPGMSLRELLGPVLFGLNEPHVVEALAGRPQTFERTVPGPMGPRNSLARYIPDVVDGVVVGFVAEVTDVSPLKDAQAALHAKIAAHERTARLLEEKDAALEHAQRLGRIGSWHWEIESDIVTWSNELYRIFGHDANRIPPPLAAHRSMYLPSSWRTIEEAIHDAVRHGTPYVIELQYRRPDGAVGWLEARGEVERDSAGAVVGLFGTAQDVTERRALMDLRRVGGAFVAPDADAVDDTVPRDAVAFGVARRLELRLAELAEVDARRADFLSLLGHELRNFLAPLSMGLKIVQVTTSAETTARMHEIMTRQVGHMARLVDDLFDLRRVERGELSLRRAPTSLRRITDDAVHAVRLAVEDAGVELLVDAGPHDFVVDGDETRLTQVLCNLLNNAVKFTPRGGCVAVSLDGDEPGVVAVAVVDSGIGMSARAVESVFGLYVREGVDASSGSAGLGIGLHLVKRLVELHGGTVFAASPGPGCGSRFVVRLPLAGAAGC